MSSDDDGLLNIADRAVRSAYRTGAVNRWTDPDDITSDALWGVAMAWRLYNPDIGVPFGAFAFMKASWAIKDGVRRRGQLSTRELDQGTQVRDLPASRLRPVDLEDAVDLAGPDRLDDEVSARVDLDRILATLAPLHRDVLLASYRDGLSLADFAALHGFTESWASYLRKDARAALLAMLMD